MVKLGWLFFWGSLVLYGLTIFLSLAGRALPLAFFVPLFLDLSLRLMFAAIAVGVLTLASKFAADWPRQSEPPQ